MNNFFRQTSLLILSILLLSSCGWQLRGHNNALENVQSVHINSRNQQSELVQDLKRSLEAINVATASDLNKAQYSLVLLDERSLRRTATVSAGARVAEYLLVEEADVLILAADGSQLLPRTTLSVERVYEFDENNVLANDDEAKLLKKEMRSNLTRQIIDLLRVASQKSVQSTPAVSEPIEQIAPVDATES